MSFRVGPSSRTQWRVFGPNGIGDELRTGRAFRRILSVRLVACGR